MTSEEDTIVINGQHVRKDEKVLVERGGKFELISASKLKAMMPAETNPKSKDKTKKKSEPKGTSKRSKTPPPARTQKDSKIKVKTSTSHSAPPTRNKTSTIDYKSIKSPYAMSPEMKTMMKKQAEAKAMRQREEEEEARHEDEETRKTAEQAWKAWLEKKNKEMKNQFKSDGSKETDEDLAQQRQEAARAYRSWLHGKQKQRRKERLHMQQLQIEEDEGFYLRERSDCNKAFHAWLRNKSKAIFKEREAAERARKQTKVEARHAKRTQDFLKSLQEAQQIKYIEYYGYRF